MALNLSSSSAYTGFWSSVSEAMLLPAPAARRVRPSVLCSAPPPPGAPAPGNGQAEAAEAVQARIGGLSMMQRRPHNSRKWIVPGTRAGKDGLTYSYVKRPDRIEFDYSLTLDLGRKLKNSRRWCALRADATKTLGTFHPRKFRAPQAEPTDSSSPGLTYKDAGVDIDAGAELVKRIAAMAPGIGGFGGLFPYGDSYLVAGTDGVGTKLKLAFETGIHDTIGIDLVAMSVNDIVTAGAEPLFFLDYFATSSLDVDLAEKVIQGIVEGCRMSNCALLGGETAEMPDFYAPGEYDLSGFAVGSVKKDKLVDGSKIEEGDVLIGLPSTGVHSNGYSLIRKLLKDHQIPLTQKLGKSEQTIGQALMVPTRIYVPEVMKMVHRGGVKGIAHITGGGFTDNIPRIFPPGLGGEVNIDNWKVPPIFHWIQDLGGISNDEMYRTFNMGIGMVVVLTPEAGHSVLSGDAGIGKAYDLGKVIKGDGIHYYSNNWV